MSYFKSIFIALMVATASSANSQATQPSAAIHPAKTIDAAHFHHVRLNVTDSKQTIDFYKKFFGASEIAYRGQSNALFTEKSFLLMDTVKRPPASNEGSSLWHIGWAGVDGASEFGWRAAEGIRVHTPLTRPVLPGIDNKAEYMYFWGPDKELVEVATGSRNHRFEHVHLLSSDVKATTTWFKEQLGLAPDLEKAIDFYGVVMNSLHADNVNIVIFARPIPDRDNQFAAKDLWPAGGFQPTEGRAVNHIAFSYRSIAPVIARMKAAGVPIVKGIATDARHGHKSFFVRGPDNLLVEIVEDKPVPEGIWTE